MDDPGTNPSSGGDAPSFVEDPADASEGSPMDVLWARVLDAWDDDNPHNAALEYALSTQNLPDLAGRYRALKDDPEKAPKAQKRIDAIVVAATQMLMSTKTPERTKTPWQWSASVAIVCAIVIAWLAYKVLGHH